MKNDIIKQMMNDPTIIDKYKAIDKVNQYPFSHGLKHIYEVLELTEKLAPVFKLTERETLILKACEVLHDLGQVDGRENHGQKAAIFARDYLLKQKFFKQDEINIICSAIETHDEHDDYTKLKSNISWFVNLIDKISFSRKRLEDWAEDKFGYTAYQDIEGVDFSLKDGTFIINIKTIKNPKIINAELLYNYRGHFFNKVYITAKAFCEHFGYKLDMQLQGKSLELSRFE